MSHKSTFRARYAVSQKTNNLSSIDPYLQSVSHTDFDIDLLGDCDVVVSELCRRAGWDLQHHMIPTDEKVEITPLEGHESRHIFKVVGA